MAHPSMPATARVGPVVGVELPRDPRRASTFRNGRETVHPRPPSARQPVTQRGALEGLSVRARNLCRSLFFSADRMRRFNARPASGLLQLPPNLVALFVDRSNDQPCRQP